MFDTLTRPETLATAWKRVRANGGGAGGDSIGPEAFARDLGPRLQALARALGEGSYRPGPLRSFPIEKPGGGIRLLRIPCIADRVAQTAAAALLSAAFDARMSARSFGYRPARSVPLALSALRRAASGRPWTLDADIAKFFDRVPHEALLDDLAIWTGDARLVRLVALWLKGFGGRRGLAQGAPVSPVLANLFLHPLDEALARAGFAHVRYADDFVVLARSAKGAARARSIAAAALARRGLDLSPGKTRIVPPGAPFTFLGETLVLGQP
jgi:CRISPR-associated protein Cas1